jgi:hypothetical protein
MIKGIETDLMGDSSVVTDFDSTSSSIDGALMVDSNTPTDFDWAMDKTVSADVAHRANDHITTGFCENTDSLGEKRGAVDDYLFKFRDSFVNALLPGASPFELPWLQAKIKPRHMVQSSFVLSD